MAGVPFQVLSFDGGGIRGAFGIGLIAELEKRLGHSITDCFDLIAGTSTGAITGAGLALGKSGDELVEFYEKHGRQIFSPREPYQPQGWIRWLYPAGKWLLKNRTGQETDDFFRAKYCPIALRSAFEGGFGSSVLGDVKKTRLIVPRLICQLDNHIFSVRHICLISRTNRISQLSTSYLQRLRRPRTSHIKSCRMGNPIATADCGR